MLDRANEGAEPVTVVHLVDTLILGGTERQLVEQLKNTDRARWRPLVASLHVEGELLRLFGELDVPHRAFPIHTSLAHPNTALQIARLALFCRRSGARIIHAHDFYSNVVGVAAAHLARIASVASRRDLAHWLSPIQVRALGLACRAADRVVANARLVGERAVAELGVEQQRLEVVPNGIDLGRFDADARKEPSPPLELPVGDVPVVVVVSSMHLPDKGHADLLEAVRQLRDAGRRIELVLVGDGHERPKLEALAEELGIADSVRFLGRRTDVPQILARADAVCLPSWAEGFPNAVMEGMASSLPVVATRVGGCPELVEDGVNGLLVPPHEPRSLAAALERVLAHPEAARKMGLAARRTIEKRYSLSATVARFDALYTSLLGGEAHRAAA